MSVRLNGAGLVGACGNGGVCLQSSRWNHAAVPEQPPVGKAETPCPDDECSECGCQGESGATSTTSNPQ